MNSQSNPPSSNRPNPIRDNREAPNLEPIRDDPEPMLEPTLGPPRKKPWQIDEDGDAATEKVAKRISNNLQPAIVASALNTNAKVTVTATPQEIAKLKIAREKAATHGHDMRDF